MYLNHIRKSVTGLSQDYIAYNILGFVSYSIFNGAFYWSPSIQQTYRKPLSFTIGLHPSELLPPQFSPQGGNALQCTLR